MSAGTFSAEEPQLLGPAQNRGWSAPFVRGENLLITLALGTMVILPLAEAILRRLFHSSIPGSITIVQHMVLIVGMLGGAIAAREQRLLALSNLGEAKLRGRWKVAARLLTGSIAVTVCVFLCLAAYQFVASERESQRFLAYGIPVWMIQCVLPLGFGVIALRILRMSSDKWSQRFVVTSCALVLCTLFLRWPETGQHISTLALGVLLLASILGVPAFITLGGTALILFWNSAQPIESIPIAHYALVTNPTLPTLPLFTLAGFFLTEGGSPRRLVRVFYALFGQFRGGPAIVTVLVCAFFTASTGASGVTILALGGLLLPVLSSAHFSEKDSLGLLTGSGSLGLLLPPCLPLIVYAIVAKVQIEKMFLSAMLPALLMMLAMAIWGMRRGQHASELQAFNWKEAREALWAAKWELLTPVVACVALFGGLATPVEAAAITALYAFLIVVVFHRELKLTRDLPRVMSECGLLIGGVLLILGVSLGFTNFLVDAEVPARAVEWTTRSIHSPFLFLLLLNLFLLIVGCLVEIYPAIVIEVPLLVPLGAAYGIDPVLLGIIFLANMELGYLTPPVGLNLLMSSYRFKKPVGEVLSSVIPAIVVLSIGVLLITYIPELTTALPKLVGY